MGLSDPFDKFAYLVRLISPSLVGRERRRQTLCVCLDSSREAMCICRDKAETMSVNDYLNRIYINARMDHTFVNYLAKIIVYCIHRWKLLCIICGDVIETEHSSCYESVLLHVSNKHRTNCRVHCFHPYNIIIKKELFYRFPDFMKSMENAYLILLSGDMAPLINYIRNNYPTDSGIISGNDVDLPRVNEIMKSCLTKCVICGLVYESHPSLIMCLEHVKKCYKMNVTK